jgi:uncharacterized oligopeptide transporter (OPT) family protein
LISALAQGVIGGNLDWKLIGIGAIIGVCLICLDAALKLTKRMSLPPLAVGIGIYLPMSATFAVVVGAVVGYWYNKPLIVGFKKDAPIAVVAENFWAAPALGLLGFAGLVVFLYGWMLYRVRGFASLSGRRGPSP